MCRILRALGTSRYIAATRNVCVYSAQRDVEEKRDVEDERICTCMVFRSIDRLPSVFSLAGRARYDVCTRSTRRRVASIDRPPNVFHEYIDEVLRRNHETRTYACMGAFTCMLHAPSTLATLFITKLNYVY
jgi:hypothetical protein